MRKKYRVYLKQYFYDKVVEKNTGESTKFLGETYAVSEAQAINNVRYRVYGESNPEGDREIDYACGGIWTEFKAEEA